MASAVKDGALSAIDCVGRVVTLSADGTGAVVAVSAVDGTGSVGAVKEAPMAPRDLKKVS